MTDVGVLVHCEVVEGELSSIATELLGVGSCLAQELEQPLSAVLIGNNIGVVAQEAIYYGADKVYLVDDPLLENYITDSYLQAMENVINIDKPRIVLFGQTWIGLDLTPRLAFRLETAAIMDCLALSIDPNSKRMLMTKPVYGGNAQTIQVCETDPQIATVRMKAMAPLEKNSNRDGEIIRVEARINPAMVRTKIMDRKLESVQGVKLEDADVIVTGGRGIGGPEGFQELEHLADVLKGAIGASRPACDNKWVLDNIQIGLTGKIVSPDVYIAVGVSGSSQHLSGCSGSKVIIAINKDPDANIFNVAQYGIVADWKRVIPAFIAKVSELM